jgi:hypothetical protein
MSQVKRIDPAFIAEAKEFGWDIDPVTGEWRTECNVCSKYAVISNASCVCQECVDRFMTNNKDK